MDPEEFAAAGLLYDVTDGVATVTLDRPEVRNAQTPHMWRTLAAIGDQVPDDVRVVVVRGTGPAFSAGLDRAMLDPDSAGKGVETVAGLLMLSDEEASAAIEEFQRGFTWLRDPRFVSVAVVQGYAIGAGFQLALSCDLRVVSDDAQLCMKESALGLVPDLTGTQPLVTAVGYARALEICATARNVGAEEALAIGLANVVVPTGELDATVADLVAALTAALPGAVRETKALLLAASGRTLDEQRRIEREAQVRRFRELHAKSAGSTTYLEQDPPAGQRDRTAQALAEQPVEPFVVGEVPEHLSRLPGARAGQVDPERREAVVELPADPVHDRHRPLVEPVLDLVLRLVEHVVGLRVVGVLGRVLARPDHQLAAGVDHGVREVVGDVGVHAGEGELDRQDVRTLAGLEQGGPCGRDALVP